jgi:formylglycine-generating enzyme required for sulfatase activity
MINTPMSSTALLKLLVAILLSLSPSIAFTQPEEATFQGIEFVKVTPGTFTLGSITSQEGRIANETERRVLIDHSFWIGKYEVTQGQWQAVMGSNPSTFRALGPDLSYPVETVSWYDAQQFIEALNANAGGVYFRLPTEAEWEYVAKANTHGRWSFGEIEAALSDYAYRDGVHKPRMRGGKLANAWGVYDLYGNVYEWCEDWYQMSARPERGACPPEMGTYKVIRGGSNTAPSSIPSILEPKLRTSRSPRLLHRSSISAGHGPAR